VLAQRSRYQSGHKYFVVGLNPAKSVISIDVFARTNQLNLDNKKLELVVQVWASKVFTLKRADILAQSFKPVCAN